MIKEKGYFLALDQGTTSTRAMAFDHAGGELARHQIELKQYYPKAGWVEHDPEEIWTATCKVIKTVLDFLPDQYPLAMGITNQRETTVLWDKKTGKPVYNAIVWQDRRTAEFCADLKRNGHESMVTEKTGLLLDPYFSASKLHWILEQNNDLRNDAAKGKLAFGTIESYLLFRLSGGLHISDITNASRTMLFNIRTGEWDDELLDLFQIPSSLLPEVVENIFEAIPVSQDLFGVDFPITAMIGDQQSAAIGQGCIETGSIKSTYGTGCFVLQNTGRDIVKSENKLLSTISYKIDGVQKYALEGSIFNAGTVVQWLRDDLKFIEKAEHTEDIAASLKHNHGIYMVPAFTGMGAPHWDPEARGAILGLTRNSRPEHIVRAALESVAYQTHDLFMAFVADSSQNIKKVRVDGGMVDNRWFVQFLADILNIPVERPRIAETTALGAAFLASLGIGMYSQLKNVDKFWKLDTHFEPEMKPSTRNQHLAGWNEALKKVLS